MDHFPSALFVIGTTLAKCFSMLKRILITSPQWSAKYHLTLANIIIYGRDDISYPMRLMMIHF